MISTFSIGTSVNRKNIDAFINYDVTRKALKIHSLIIGGMHGDEKAPVPILESFIANHLKTKKNHPPVCIIPLLNPDGYEANTRTNARGVDINRNFPLNWQQNSEEPSGSKPLSEPESRVLYDFIITHEPQIIINLHWALSEIDADGEQSIPVAKAMWDALSENGKKLFRLKHALPQNKQKGDICPGSLGQWCGFGVEYKNGLRPAMITVELPYTIDTVANLYPLPVDSCTTVQRNWRKNGEEYLRVVEREVFLMLEAGL